MLHYDWFPLIVTVVYSLWVCRGVEEVDSTTSETETDGDADNQVHNYVLRSLLFIDLALRVLCGVLCYCFQEASIPSLIVAYHQQQSYP